MDETLKVYRGSDGWQAVRKLHLGGYRYLHISTHKASRRGFLATMAMSCELLPNGVTSHSVADDFRAYLQHPCNRVTAMAVREAQDEAIESWGGLEHLLSEVKAHLAAKA